MNALAKKSLSRFSKLIDATEAPGKDPRLDRLIAIELKRLYRLLDEPVPFGATRPDPTGPPGK